MSEPDVHPSTPPPAQWPTPMPAPYPQHGLSYAGPAATPEVYAGFGLRLAAWLLDWLILGGLRCVTFMFLGFVAMLIEEAGLETPAVETVGGFTILAVVFLCAWPYYAIMEASKLQATVGKLAVGIRVEDIEGGRPTLLQTNVRFFLRMVSALILGIGFLMVAMTRRSQALHDIGANTIVTRKPAVPQWVPGPAQPAWFPPLGPGR